MTDKAQPAGAAKAPAKSARRRAREFALQGLYQWRVGGQDEAAIEAYLPDLEGFAKADREFCQRIIRGELKELTFLEEGKCAAAPSPAPIKR